MLFFCLELIRGIVNYRVCISLECIRKSVKGTNDIFQNLIIRRRYGFGGTSRDYSHKKAQKILGKETEDRIQETGAIEHEQSKKKR